VLFVQIQLHAGGSEKIVLELARHLDRSRFNIYSVSFSGGALEKSFSETCNGVFRIEKKNGFDPGALLKISRLIRENRIDVVNAHHYMPFFYSYPGAKMFHRRRLIYTEHSVPEVEGICSSMHRHLGNLMFHQTDAIVGVSEEIAERFKSAFPGHGGKTVTIPNGIDVKRFAACARRGRMRSEWGFLPEDFVIGCVANFRGVKNHLCLLRAFRLLSAAYSHLRLVLVGRGYPNDAENTEDQVKRYVRENHLDDRVLFTGYREDIPEILDSLNIFCLPSFSEGLPVSILEAMAARVPVVGSNVQGIREVLFPERTGLLFPPDDPDALARTMERLMKQSELRRDLSEHAFRYVCETHGLARWVATYEHLFERPLTKKGTPGWL
jgi:glycosyltransferase involved in cell wall biosynthesis